MIHNSPRGQGLMETIVALGVIMTGLVSVISLTISNLNAERDSAMRYRAVNFAREALELARYQRDTNWIAGMDAFNDIPRGTDLVLEFDPANAAFSIRGSGSEGDRRITQCASGQFAQGVAMCATPTGFSRTLDIVALDCADTASNLPLAQCPEIKKTDPVALQVTAKVGWQSGSETRAITLQEIFYDWR